MAQLICENLTLGYDGKPVVRDLNFTVSKGDYLCIIGDNGVGKSTLIKTILHLIAPISGKIECSDGFTFKDVSYLPQQSEIQRDFPASAWEIVLSGCMARGGFKLFYNKEDKKIAAANMERLGISALKNSCYRELSGGQQQRILLARALCATTKMLLLDEPVAGLDPKATVEMYGIIRELNGEGITIIMISHDMQATLKYASHILHIGEPLFFGTRDQYLSSSAFAQLNKSAEVK